MRSVRPANSKLGTRNSKLTPTVGGISKPDVEARGTLLNGLATAGTEQFDWPRNLTCQNDSE